MTQQEKEIHPSLAPLEWIMGKWRSVQAKGFYPTIQPFTYNEEIEFISVGQPMLNYVSNSWNSSNSKPMHLERGFLRIVPNSNKVSFMVAHNFGLTSLEEGFVTGLTLNLQSTNISRMSLSKEPHVTEISRSFLLNEEGKLELCVSMATTKTPLTEHLRVVYERYHL